MAIYEQDKVFYSEESNGDKTIFLPITRANNVEGLGRSTNTSYAVGDVVYADSNKKVSLKCTTAGTTSANELDISSNNIGDTVTDGGVVWQACNRTSDVTSVNGSVGDVVIDDYVNNASINGKEITLTFANGTTKTLTTQDTAPFTESANAIGGASATKPAVVVTSYKSGETWYRKYSDGWVEQGGCIAANTGGTVTLPVAMGDANYYAAAGLIYNGDTYGYDSVVTRTTTKVTFYSTPSAPRLWYVCGKGA